MNTLRNRVQLIGNLGINPEVKVLDKGQKVCRFSMATNESYINKKGEKVTETQWHNIVAWGNVAEIAEKYLNKGSEVAVEGKIVNSNFTGKDGNKRYITEIVISELLMLGGRKES